MLKIGSRIKRLRMEKDARQNALAAYLDVDARLIDDWEQDRSLPPLELLPKPTSKQTNSRQTKEPSK